MLHLNIFLKVDFSLLSFDIYTLQLPWIALFSDFSPLCSLMIQGGRKKISVRIPVSGWCHFALFIIQFNFQHTFQTVRVKDFLVLQKTFSGFEPLWTIITLELWQPMAQFMLFKVCCPGKRFATFVTFEWFFSSVNSHMTSHVGCITHSNATYATFMPVHYFSMSSEMDWIFFMKLILTIWKTLGSLFRIVKDLVI